MRLVLFASVAFVAAACGTKAGEPAPTAPMPASTPSAAPAPTTLVVGKSCAADTDCVGAASNGGGATCFETSFGLPLPGGFCSAKCKAQADCGGPADKVVCGTTKGSEMPGAPDTCHPRCDPNAKTCRAGYVCRPILTNGQPTSDYGCHIPPPG